MAENSYLADSRLFYGLELEQLAALYQISAMETFVEEERIFSEGDFGEYLYIVIEGGVRISITTPGAGEEALAILKPGDSFGEMAVIDRERRARSANAVAQQNCSLLMISQHDLHGLF